MKLNFLKDFKNILITKINLFSAGVLNMKKLLKIKRAGQ